MLSECWHYSQSISKTTLKGGGGVRKKLCCLFFEDLYKNEHYFFKRKRHFLRSVLQPFCNCCSNILLLYSIIY